MMKQWISVILCQPKRPLKTSIGPLCLMCFLSLFLTNTLFAKPKKTELPNKAASFPLREGSFLFPWQIKPFEKKQQRLSKHFKAKVMGIPDANTVILLIQKTPIRFRLAGIDAPDKNQFFGNEAQHHLSNLIFMKNVRAEMKEINTEIKELSTETTHSNPKNPMTDTPITLFFQQKNMNLELIKQGLAWCDQHSKNQNCLQAQHRAKQQKTGLWQQKEPAPPWAYRSKLKKTVQAHSLASQKNWRKNDFYLKMIKAGQSSADYQTNTFTQKQVPYTKPLPKLQKKRKGQ